MLAVESRKKGIRCEARFAGRQAGCGGRPRCKQRVGQGSTADWGQGTGGERTENMSNMVVTLEVSKLSGWLNADARCRESNGGHTVRDDVRASRLGRRGPARAGEGLTADWDRTGVEHTPNIWLISVTLEVSKLSDWLNADADCRESKGGRAMRGEGVVREAGGGGRSRCTQCAG